MARMRRFIVVSLALLVSLACAAAVAFGHDALDHAAPTFTQPAGPLSSEINAGGEGAEWELLDDDPDRQPALGPRLLHRAATRTCRPARSASGPNAGGQNIVRLTENGEVKPSYVTAHPSAACPGDLTSATGLQHDVEATPKGDAFQQQPNPFIARGDAQLLIDATDATGRCHDNGNFGAQARRTAAWRSSTSPNPTKPKEIALTATSATRTRSTSTPSARTSPSTSRRTASRSTRRRPGKRANEARRRLRPSQRARRLRGPRHVVVHELPGRHDDRAEARALPARGLPLPLSRGADGDVAHVPEHRCRAATRSRSIPTTASRARRSRRRSCSTSRARSTTAARRTTSPTTSRAARRCRAACASRRRPTAAGLKTGAPVIDCVNGAAQRRRRSRCASASGRRSARRRWRASSGSAPSRTWASTGDATRRSSTRRTTRARHPRRARVRALAVRAAS